MKIKVVKGFTLIELLVVITIIGILATWAVQVFTTQIQNARDATRISDITALRWGLEQVYQAAGAYPEKWANFWTEMSIYVPRMPSDPKSTEASSNSIFDYLYNVSADSNNVSRQEYEVSTHFESQGNIESRAETDGWDDDFRLEFGINIWENQTSASVASGVPSTVDSFLCIIFNDTGTQTAQPGTWVCTDAANAMIIRGS